MTQKIVLLDKFPKFRNSQETQRYLFNYQKYIDQKIKGFPTTRIRSLKLRNVDRRVQITIKGPEEIFVSNLLKKEIGTIKPFEELHLGEIHKGWMVDVGKVGFGLFIDIGIIKPKTDALIKLHTLRDQLCNAKKKSLKEIIDLYNFTQYFPVFVEIIGIEQEEQGVSVKLAQTTMNLFKRLIEQDIEAIIASGCTKNQLKKAIENKGVFKYVISVKRFSFLEHSVLLTESTNAPGIISKIGSTLKNCNLTAVRPKRFSKFFNL